MYNNGPAKGFELMLYFHEIKMFNLKKKSLSVLYCSVRLYMSENMTLTFVFALEKCSDKFNLWLKKTTKDIQYINYFI